MTDSNNNPENVEDKSNIAPTERKTIEKVFTIVGTVLTVVVSLVAAFILINMVVCKIKNKPVSFFGMSFAIVQTNSMEPEIMTGDLIIFRECGFDDVNIGDNIVFIADANFDTRIQGKSIVHKVKDITADGIITYGVHNHGDDDGFREANELLGICTYNSAGWGKVFSFIGKFGIFIIIALIALPFIIKQIVKIVRLSKKGEEAGEKEAVVDSETNNDNQDNV